MRIPRRLPLLVVASLTLSTAAAIPAAPVAAVDLISLPVYSVAGPGVDETAAITIGRLYSFSSPVYDEATGRLLMLDESFDALPLTQTSGRGRADEDKQETVATGLDLRELRARAASKELLTTADAIRLASELWSDASVPLLGDTWFAGRRVSPAGQGGMGATANAATTQLRYAPAKGGEGAFTAPLDITVRYALDIAGVPLLGPGAKASVTFDLEGKPTLVHAAFPVLEPAGTVQAIDGATARKRCAEQLPRGAAKLATSLAYMVPELTPNLGTVYPVYTCTGVGPRGIRYGPLTITAVAEDYELPRITSLRAGIARDGRVSATVRVTGGEAPYRVTWSSSTGSRIGAGPRDRSVEYVVSPRDGRGDAERLTAIVRDRNGRVVSATATMSLPDAAEAPVRPAASGVQVGGEFNVYEWTCVQQSSAGFQSEFSSEGVPISFRFNAPNAWERDFRDTVTKSGKDSSYVDNVDLAWYTGHGWPDGFTFDNATKDDDAISTSTSDARWGNGDLEWLQLDSCNVLQYANSAGTTVWERWAKAFDGLHLLNGFQSVASCIDVPGGSAGRFADWMLGREIGSASLPPVFVKTAWRLMAAELQPAGRQYVTMSAVGAGGLTNLTDYFWGRGATGPDIPKAQITGYVWIVGTA